MTTAMCLLFYGCKVLICDEFIYVSAVKQYEHDMLIYNEFSSSLMLLVYDKFSDEFCYIIHDEFVLHSVMNLVITNECRVITFCDEFSDELICHRMSTTPRRIHVAAMSDPRGDHVVATSLPR